VTSVTLGIDEPERLLARMKHMDRFPIWKVKIGTDAEESTLDLIRRTSPDRTVRVDANMGWTAADAPVRLDRIARFKLELLEQPCSRDDLDTLSKLKKAGVLPIVADESCVRPSDVERIADYVDGINIKLSKCGGIQEAGRMIAMARKCGLSVMLGCMIESSLGIAAAAQLGPQADWIDLDGHLLIANDPFSGLGGSDGHLTIGQRPGLGILPQ